MVDDVSHVRLVDAHAERVRSHHDRRVVVHERTLVGLALARGKARMVARRSNACADERIAERLDVLARAAIDDAAVARVLECIGGNAGELALRGKLMHLEAQVRAVEPRDHSQRVA